MADPDDFMRRLFARVLADTHRHQAGAAGHPVPTPHASTPVRMAIRDAVDFVAGLAGYSPRRFPLDSAAAFLARAAQNAPALARVEALLADERSRELLLRILSFRALGPMHVALPVAERDFRAACTRIDRELRVEAVVASNRDGHELHRYELSGRQGRVSLIGQAFMVHEFYELEQYALERDGVELRAEPGDVVVDGGAGWGETALYFADAVGDAGRVLCFEFFPDSLDLLRRNLGLNDGLRERIEVIEHPLWDRPGAVLDYGVAGGQSSLVMPLPGDRAEVTTASLDEACRGRAIDRVDFIKLDVEGAELAALRGAEQVIRRSIPKLAISIYHSDEDLTAIPDWVAGLDLGYELYLDHLWPGVAETILFARPPR